MAVDPLIITIVAVFVGFAALAAAFVALSKRYIKVPPNRALVIAGRKNPHGQRRDPTSGQVEDNVLLGYTVVQGGTSFVKPMLEEFHWLRLDTITVPIEVQKIITDKGVPLHVKGIAQIKVKSDAASLNAAAEQILGKSEAQLGEMAQSLLEAHVRGACTQLPVESINSDRNALQEKIRKEAVPDFERIGLDISVFAIQDITDSVGFLDALGQERTAQVKRDAEVGKAKADRERRVEVANNQRDAQVAEAMALQQELKVKQTASEMTGKTAEADNAALVAEAEKNRDVKKAQFQATTQREQAVAAAAKLIEDQKQQQAVKDEEAKVREKQERINQVIPAEKAAEALAAKAEGEKRKTIIDAEAEARKTVVDAEAAKQQTILDAEASAEQVRKEAAAEADRINLVAKATAEQIRITGQAQAEANEKVGLADAAVILAKGKAKAEALNLEAEALQKMQEAGKLQIMMPAYVEAAKALGASLQNTEKIIVMGGSGPGELAGSMGQMLLAVPEVVKAMTGVSPLDLVRQTSQAIQGKGGEGGDSPPPPPPSAAPPTPPAPPEPPATPAASTPPAPAKTGKGKDEPGAS